MLPNYGGNGGGGLQGRQSQIYRWQEACPRISALMGRSPPTSKEKLHFTGDKPKNWKSMMAAPHCPLTLAFLCPPPSIAS